MDEQNEKICIEFLNRSTQVCTIFGASRTRLFLGVGESPKSDPERQMPLVPMPLPQIRLSKSMYFWALLSSSAAVGTWKVDVVRRRAS